MAVAVALLLLAALFALYFFFALVGTILAFLPWVIIGLIAGWIASAVTNSRHGLLGDIVIGLAGSVIGGVLYTMITGASAGGPLSPSRLVVAILGAILLLTVVNVVGKEAV